MDRRQEPDSTPEERAGRPEVKPVRLAMFADRVAGYDRTLPGFAVAWQELTGKILAAGGTAVVPPLVQAAELPGTLAEIRHLAAAGAELIPSRVRFLRGEAHGCHFNAARIVLGKSRRKRSGAASADGIGTGYALSADGCWRPHSWAMDGDVLIETTERRIGYWGLVLRGADAVHWARLML